MFCLCFVYIHRYTYYSLLFILNMRKNVVVRFPFDFGLSVGKHLGYAKVHVLRANRCGQDGFVQDALKDLLRN